MVDLREAMLARLYGLWGSEQQVGRLATEPPSCFLAS